MENITTPIILISLAVIASLVYVFSRKAGTSSDSENGNTVIKEINLEPKSSKASQNNDNKDQAQSPASKQKKKPKKKKKSTKQPQAQTKPVKTQKQIQQTYSQIYYGSINLKPQQNSIHGPTCIAYKNSKILVGTTKNQLILYDLKKWKKQDPKTLEKYFISLENNTPTAVCIGGKHYFVALGFDKTIIYFQFVGQNGVYFKEAKKFFRNILKSDASAIYVPDDQKYIITAGSQADTTLNVWSMNGQKLHSFNTYQIQHYDIKFSLRTVMVRGWTSQVKLFQIKCDKNNNFLRIQKGHHLSIPDQPLYSSMDNFAMYSLTISKQYKISLWDLNPINPLKMQIKIAQPYQIDLDQITVCLVHTLRDENERYKTLTIFADNNKIVICDKEFKVHQVIEGIECKSLDIIGSMKNVVLLSQNKQGRIVVWNLTKIVEGFEQYAI